MKSIRRIIVCLLLMLVVPARAQVVDWLYDIDVPLTDSSAESRTAAARAALAIVIGRLSGLPELPDNPALNAALRAPDRYYVRYGFTEAVEDGATVSKLRVRFSSDAVLRLLGEAGVSVWGANRPVLMVWAAIDGDDGRVQILSADSTHPLALALEARAELRGLPLVLPAMDLDDELAVPVDAVVGGVTLVLREAAMRYRADGMLILRLRGPAPGPWRLDGRIVLPDDDQAFRVEVATPEQLAAAAVDPAVRMLVARYAVQAGEQGFLAFRIDGVSNLDDYAAVVRYLQGLEFIDRVAVDRVDHHALHVSLVTRTPWAQLKDLLDLDGRLVATEAPEFAVGNETLLLWRGTSR